MPCSSRPGSTFASSSGERSPLRVSASHGPATTRDQSGSALFAAAVLRDVRAGEHPHGLGEREPTLRREPFGLLEATHHPLEPFAIDLDPLAADEREPVCAGQDLLHLGGGQPLAVERDLHAEVEQRILAERGRRLRPDGGGHLRPGRAPGPPGRGHANHDAGALQLRDVAEKAKGLLRRPAQRMKDLARVDHLLEPGAALGRALDREQERQKALLVGRAGVLAQRLAERQVLGLAVRREPGGVGREEGEGRLLVLAVLGEVEVHPAHDVPGRVQALEEVLDRGLRFGLLGGEGLT